MSSWGTNPWSNFCDPHWELTCRNKWHPGNSEIAIGTYFYVSHGTKTTPVHFPAAGDASWLLLPSLVSLLSGSTVQPENTYSCRLANKIHVITLMQAGMQANQFASAIDCASNITNFTKNPAGKSLFFLKTQRGLVLKVLWKQDPQDASKFYSGWLCLVPNTGTMANFKTELGREVMKTF